MYAINVASPGGPDRLEYVAVPQPEVGPTQVLVRAGAIGVNFVDTYLRSGVYATTFPHRPGSEGAGEVVAVGEDVTTARAGDRVAWASSATGSYAEYVLLEAEDALEVPAQMDLAVAGALPLQGMTAHMLVDGVTTLGEQDTVFITAGAGGVGLLFIQLAKARGARVITMVGTAAKAEKALKAGANRVFVHKDFTDVTTELPTLLRELTDGRGVDVFYDGLGRATFDAAVASVRRRGLVVLFGGASGQVPPFDLQRLNAAGSLFVTRPTVGHYIAEASERAWRWRELTVAVEGGDLRVEIGARFPLASAREAHEALEGRATTGKVILLP